MPKRSSPTCLAIISPIRTSFLPAGCRPDAAGDDIARSIGDFIAGMTDRFALSEHARIFELDPGFALGGAGLTATAHFAKFR